MALDDNNKELDDELPNEPYDDEDNYDEEYEEEESSSIPSGGRLGDIIPSKEGMGGGHKNLTKLKGGMASKGGAATSKAAMAGLKAAAPYIGIALLVIAIIIILVSAIMAIVSFFEEKTDPANMTTNNYITSDYFYGIRTVYIDDEQLANSLQLSYKQYVIDVVENIESSNPNIEIAITLPEQTNEQFNNLTDIDTNIVNLSLGIGNIIATGSSEYINIDFAQLYPNIEYFGFTTEQGELVSKFISDYIEQNNLYLSQETVNLEQLVATTTSNENLQYIYNRCEKVMIKDEIATEEGLSNLEQRQYIASIYMPNKNIQITSASYTVANQNEDFTTYIKLIEVNNGTETIHLDQVLEDDVDIFDGITWGSVDLNTFTSIDSSNISQFEQEVSLFDAINKSTNNKQYFTQNTETSIYTWKPISESLLYLQFSSNNKFIYTEFDINMKVAN